jgi:hypothetical protein
MVTDKDFAQLVSENIFMYKPALGNGIVKCKFQRDQQVIDTSG